MRIDELDNKMEPAIGLIVYKGNNTPDYTEVINFKDGKQINSMPATKELLQEICKYTYDKSETLFNGFFKKEILFYSDILKIFWFKEQKVKLRFKSNDLIDGEYTLPAAIVCLHGKDRVNVFALGHNRKPRIKDKIYYYPLPNIDENGWMCTGDNEINLSNYPNKNVDVIKKIVFDGIFTEHHIHCYKEQFKKWYKGTDTKKLLIENVKGRRIIDL